MRAAVEVRYLAKARARLAAAAGAPGREALRRLQEPFDEGVGVGHAMLPLRHLYKEVRRIAPGIPLPVQAHDARDLWERGAAGRGLPPPSIPQAVIAAPLVAQAPGPQGARTTAQDPLGLHPRQLAAHRLQHHLLHFLHCPLHDSRGIGRGGSPQSTMAHPAVSTSGRSGPIMCALQWLTRLRISYSITR
jgi:hypothetical protein